MKKFAVLMLLVAFSTGLAFSQNTLTISATVAASVSVSVANTNAQALTLTTAGSQTKKVGEATFSSNTTGWTVSVSSANNGVLLGTLGSSVAYTLLIADIMGTSTALTTAAKTFSQSLTMDALMKNVSITYTGVPTLAADTYSDTVTITVSAP